MREIVERLRALDVDTIHAREVADDAAAEIERLRAALREIEDHWGEPLPLGVPDRVIIRKWMDDYTALKTIARAALARR
jgi:hypothetical protein